MTAIRSKPIFLRLMNCSFSWYERISFICVFFLLFVFIDSAMNIFRNNFLSRFTNTLVYYGLSINSVVLSGNKYINFILCNGVEVPAFFVSGFIMNKMDRRISQSVAFFLSGLTCIICEFIPLGELNILVLR